MDILELIKNRKTVRKYKNEPIADDILNKIIEAGRWASSVHGYQPWKFIVIQQNDLIKKVAETLTNTAKNNAVGAKVLISSTAKTIGNANVLIAIYNTGEFERLAVKFEESYIPIAKLAELSAISASIQNMVLMADSLNVGVCWLSIPLFCEKELKELFLTRDDLVAILSLGYPEKEVNRGKRKPLLDVVRYIK